MVKHATRLIESSLSTTSPVALSSDLLGRLLLVSQDWHLLIRLIRIVWLLDLCPAASDRLKLLYLKDAAAIH